MLELGELTRDENRLLAVLHDPRLEVALGAVDLDPVVARHQAPSVDRLAHPVHDLVRHFGGEDVVSTTSEQLLRRGDEVFRMAVEVEVRAFAVEAEHEVRRGVEERPVAAFALAQCLHGPLAGQRQARRGADRIDQIPLVRERRVVDEGRHDLALVLDERRCLPFTDALGGQVVGPPVGSDPLVRVRQPDGQVEVRVVERARNGVAELAQAVCAEELDHEDGNRRAGEPDLQEAREERERDERE
jgi:hypothetical protein